MQSLSTQIGNFKFKLPISGRFILKIGNLHVRICRKNANQDPKSAILIFAIKLNKSFSEIRSVLPHKN